MTVYTIFSLKGGVGKTTTTTMFARWLAAQGERVLVVDADIQKATTAYFLQDEDDEDGRSLAAAIFSENLAENAVPARASSIFRQAELFAGRIDVVPSSLDLLKFNSLPERKIPQLIEKMPVKQGRSPYDYILIDCPASWNPLVVGSIVAAERVLVPVYRHKWDVRAALYFMGLGEDDYGINPDKYFAFLNRAQGSVVDAAVGSEAEQWGVFISNALGDTWSGREISKSRVIENSTNFYEPITPSANKVKYFNQFNRLFSDFSGLPPVSVMF